MIQTDQKSCSTQDQDTCIENYITNQLNNSLRCKPKWMDLNLPTCKDLQIHQLAEEDAQISLQNIDLLCQRTCKTIEIKTWSRNFIKDITRHRIYLYFPFKVAVHTEKYLISPLALVAEIGGTAGLLLGVSFYHAFQLILFLIDMKINKL